MVHSYRFPAGRIGVTTLTCVFSCYMLGRFHVALRTASTYEIMVHGYRLPAGRIGVTTLTCDPCRAYMLG